MIKNIVFDMGNVLLDYNPQRILDTYVTDTQHQKFIYETLFNGVEWRCWDLGIKTKRQIYDELLESAPEDILLREELWKCLDKWYICMTPLKGARQCVLEYKEAGYGVYVLSNAGDDFYEYFPNFMPVDTFDGIVVSSYIHAVKPEPEIYRYLLNTYNLNADECIFIDDRADNVEAAIQCGFHAVQFNGDFDVLRDAVKSFDNK